MAQPRNRSAEPVNVKVKWRQEPRTPAWDEIWLKILGEILAGEEAVVPERPEERVRSKS